MIPVTTSVGFVRIGNVQLRQCREAPIRWHFDTLISDMSLDMLRNRQFNLTGVTEKRVDKGRFLDSLFLPTGELKSVGSAAFSHYRTISPA